MKTGYGGGYDGGCGDGLDVYGFSSNAPNFQGRHEVDNYNQRFSYDASRNLTNPYTGATLTKKVSPELWARLVDQVWYLYLARVPSRFPRPGCGQGQLTSSRADGSWFVELCMAGRHIQNEETDPPTDLIRFVSYGYNSRGIWVDGELTYLSARTTSSWPPGLDPNLRHRNDGGENPGNVIDLGDHHIVREATMEKLGSYRVGTSDGHISLFNSDASAMEDVLYEGTGLANILAAGSGGASTAQAQPPCNCISQGLKYFAFSSYVPGSAGWIVGRVKYEGQRLDGPDGSYADGLEVFVSHPVDKVGAEGTTYVGNYYIVLFSCRVHLDSSVNTAEDPDEPWAIAIHKTTGKVVVGKFHNRVFRDEGGTAKETDYYHFADGTLTDAEVENVIFDPGDLPEGLEDAVWDNLEIRSYQRIYDPTTGHSKDLVLFTTHEDGAGVSAASDVVADFEQPGSYEPTFLDSGLEDAGLHWTTGGQLPGDGWISDPTDPIDGTYSARTQFQDVTILDDVELRITFNAVTAGDITLNYRHDNRRWGKVGEVWTTITNIPEPDNFLDIRVDGALLSGSDFTIDAVEQDTSRIDNVNVPGLATSEPDYTTVREIKIHVTAGTHTLTLTLHREFQDNGHLFSQIDSVAFGMDVMVGEDINGRFRWLFNGERVQSIPWWAWPRRDEEVPIDITSRVSTLPDFVTMDSEGRILYCNAHYDVRLRRSEDQPTLFELDPDFGRDRGDGFTDEAGFVRYTASPNIEMPGAPPCADPDFRVIDVDQVADVPWGGAQLMPVCKDKYQKRGANGTLRDATVYPFLGEDYPYRRPTTGHINYEQFAELTRVHIEGGWPQRVQGWTVSDNGKKLEPHVELVWRPAKQQEAWPGPESEWTSPPYQSDFASSTEDDAVDALTIAGNMRPRDPLRLPPSSQAPRWPITNFICTATYSDSLSQFPQFVWVVMLGGDPPNDPEDPNYWDPDEGSVLSEFAWPSTQHSLTQARFTPTGFFDMFVDTTVLPETICPDGETEKAAVTWRVRFHSAAEGGGGTFYGFTDYEAVPCKCHCCDE